MYELIKDEKDLHRRLIEWISLQFKERGFSKAVIGVSGGIDSAVTLQLAAKALGKENVFGYFIPGKRSSDLSREHAEMIAEVAGIKLETRDIGPVVELYYREESDVSLLREGNYTARQRMCFLYDMSSVNNSLVMGCSNLTEIMLGYGTLFGDTAWSISPIASLLKTSVRSLAKEAGVPEPILIKPPTADLWEGQTDEAEMNFSYDQADRVLKAMIFEKYNGSYSKKNDEDADSKVKMHNVKEPFAKPELQEIPDEIVDRIYKRYLMNRFKREPQGVPDFSLI